MSENDLKANARVRKVLTEYNVDLSHVKVSTTSGSVRVSGELRKLAGHEMRESEIPRFLLVLESVIVKIKNVKRVSFDVKGWKKEKGKWGKQEGEGRKS